MFRYSKSCCLISSEMLRWLHEKLSHCLQYFSPPCCSRWHRTWGTDNWTRVHEHFNLFKDWATIRKGYVLTENENYSQITLVLALRVRFVPNQNTLIIENQILNAKQQRQKRKPTFITAGALRQDFSTVCPRLSRYKA